MVFSNKVYDRLKWIAQYFLPGLATFWLALAKIWSFPYGVEIGATISAADIFLGVLLGISSANYGGEGSMIVDSTDPEKDVFTLEVNGDPLDLAEKKSVMFKVVNK